MASMAIDVLDLNWRILQQWEEKKCTRKGLRRLHCNLSRARGDRCHHREKHGEGSRITALERVRKVDIDEDSDESDERKLTDAEWKRRRRSARRLREDLILSQTILHSESILRERALAQLEHLAVPEILSARIETLERSSEIGNHSDAVFLVENDIAVQQHIAA